MNSQLDDVDKPTGDARYDALPKVVRKLHDSASYAWLSDAEKNKLIQTETEPEYT